MRIKDETGNVYGKLTVLHDSGVRTAANGCVVWTCVCECGQIHFAAGYDLRRGRINSCGCSRKKVKL